MAAEHGPKAQHLSFFEAAAAEARRWGVLALLRGGEARAMHLPRIGRARTPDRDIAELIQAPTTYFPGPTLESIEIRKERPRVTGYWFGLTGPMGPLPLHLTEFAAWEQRYGKSRPFGRFLDLIAGRMLQLFYRAWADSSATAQADRPDDDRFAGYLAALTGAEIAVPKDARFPARARLHYASLFASHRSIDGIADALTDLLGMRVEVEPFQPRWRQIDPGERSQLGAAYCGLGTDMVAGAEVRSVTDAFRIVVRAKTFAEFEDLLPTGRRFAIAAEALDAFAPSHLEWDIQIELDESEIPPAKLDGKARLGWTGWLQPSGDGGVRGDARLTRAALKRPAAAATEGTPA